MAMGMIGVLLLMGLAMVVVESVGYVRGGYGAAFWKLPLDQKLEHVSRHRWEWWWISLWALVGLFFMSAGVFGFAYLLAQAGEGALAWVALGGYAVALISWVFGSTLAAAGVSQASKQLTDKGATPDWIRPLWDATYLAEGMWVIGANLAYAVFGVGILGSGIVAAWAGWVALIAGLAIPVIVVITRDGFPQLGLLVPAIVGVVLLIGG